MPDLIIRLKAQSQEPPLNLILESKGFESMAGGGSGKGGGKIEAALSKETIETIGKMMARMASAAGPRRRGSL